MSPPILLQYDNGTGVTDVVPQWSGRKSGPMD